MRSPPNAMSFTIPSSAGFPTTSSTGYGTGAGLAVGEPTIEGVGAASYQQFEFPSIESEELIAVPSYTESISVTLPTTTEGFNVEGVPRVIIGNTIYVPGSTSLGATEVPGTFTFSPTTKLLTIYPSTTEPPQAGETIRYSAIQDKATTYTNEYTGIFPQFFKDWNAYGSISLEHSLGQSPSGSFSFLYDPDDFRPCDLGEGVSFEFEGESYGIAAVSAEFNPLDTDGLAVYSAQLQGAHDYILDDQVRYRGEILDITNASGDGGADGSGGSFSFGSPGLIVQASNAGSDEDAKSKVKIQFSELCSRAGIQYLGPDVEIRIDAERSLRDSASIGAELGRSLAVEAVPYLSNPNGLEFRGWWDGGKIHNVSPQEIHSGSDRDNPRPYSINYNVSGTEWNNVCLAAEYLNTQLNLDNEEGPTAENGRLNNTATRIAGSALSKGGGTVVYTPPQNVDRSVPTNNFDMGGPVENFIIEKYQNGQKLSKRETRYGYTYKVSDFVSFTQDPADGSYRSVFNTPELQPRLQGWGQVYEATEEYEYDDDGYLVRIKKTIETKRRFKQETAELETVNLHTLATFATSTDATLEADLKQAYLDALGLYEYFDVSEEDITEFQLESMEDLYPDLPPLETGDPPRKYVASSTRTHRYYYSSPDKSRIRVNDDGTAVLTAAARYSASGTDFSVDVKDLTVATGVDTTERLERTIVYPPVGIGEAAYREADNSYRELEERRYASGENLKNVDKPAPEERAVQGRVPIAPRLETFEDGNDPSVDDEPEEEKVNLLNTPNNGLDPDTDAIDGSVSFPSTFDKDTALKAAIASISIENTRAVEVRDGVLLAPIRRYQVGDRLRIFNAEYRLLSIRKNPIIEAAGIMKIEPYEVSLGREIDLRGEVSLDKVTFD